MEILKLLKNNLANAVSLLSVPFVLVAFHYALCGQAFLSLCFIATAFFIDTADGWIARKIRIESIRGRMIDSFCDLVIYVAFPCFFIYQFLPIDLLAMLFAGSAVMIAGIVRLARLNECGLIRDDNKIYYQGLFVPAVLVAAVAFYALYQRGVNQVLYLAAPAMAAISLLMVSNFRLRKINNWLWYVLAAILLWMAY
ncbi:MAG TPA: CDP-alcohol phosphatidyltransferase family protein [Candidatus Pacearchaeota archaeon]|nr:CDP-alcohol phosphatidyltransferase family protein [Candidatus Pacearchaeota archaeon]